MNRDGAGPCPDGQAGGDPALGRLRALLRLQLDAVGASAWATFTVLAAEVREELARQAGGAPTRAAAAEVAHLQLRVERTLRARAAAAAARLERRAVAAAYQRGRTTAGHPATAEGHRREESRGLLGPDHDGAQRALEAPADPAR